MGFFFKIFKTGDLLVMSKKSEIWPKFDTPKINQTFIHTWHLFVRLMYTQNIYTEALKNHSENFKKKIQKNERVIFLNIFLTIV